MHGIEWNQGRWSLTPQKRNERTCQLRLNLTNHFLLLCSPFVRILPPFTTISITNLCDGTRMCSGTQQDYLWRAFSFSSACFNSSSFWPASPSLPSAVRRG